MASTPTAPHCQRFTFQQILRRFRPEPGGIARQRAGAYPVSFLYNPGPYHIGLLCRGVIGIVLTLDRPPLVFGG